MAANGTKARKFFSGIEADFEWGPEGVYSGSKTTSKRSSRERNEGLGKSSLKRSRLRQLPL
jgi:hypothetical protein